MTRIRVVLALVMLGALAGAGLRALVARDAFADLDPSDSHVGGFSYNKDADCVDPRLGRSDPITTAFVYGAIPELVREHADHHGYGSGEDDNEQKYIDHGNCDFEDVDQANHAQLPWRDRFHLRARTGRIAGGGPSDWDLDPQWGVYSVGTPHRDNLGESLCHYVPEDYQDTGYSGFVAGRLDIVDRWVHQGGHVAVTYEYWYNTQMIRQDCPNPDGTHENPAGDGYVWFISIGDTDRDGCIDGEELGPNPDLGGGRDPQNFYDFYDVPTPAIHYAGANATRNKAITGFDLNALLQYAGTTDDGPPNSGGVDYDEDRDSDRTEDGREYDYAGLAGPAAGPDGGISGFDLNQMLSEGGDSCQGPPNDEPPPPAARVLIYHGNGGMSPGQQPFHSGEYFSLEARYESLGYATDYTNIFPPDLRPYRLIILPAPGYDRDNGSNFYSEEQVSALRSFVLAGRRLVALGDHSGDYGINTLNNLLERLNVDVTQNADEATTDADACPPITDAGAYTAHQVTDGILPAGGLDPSHSSSLAASGDAVWLVKSVGVANPSCQSTAGLTLMAVDKIPGAPPGAGGDVVVVGDINLLDDYIGFGDPAGDGNAGNVKFADNLVGY